MDEKFRLKKRVPLTVMRCNSYMVPNDVDFQKKYPRYRDYNSAIYLNDRRVSGPKDYATKMIYSSEMSGRPGIETKEILKALGFSDEFIESIEFVDEK